MRIPTATRIRWLIRLRKGTLHPANLPLLSENTLFIPPPMLTQMTIHRQEDHHYRISTTTSQFLLGLNGEEVIDCLEGASESRLTEQKAEGRPRGSSFVSSSLSLSPNMSPDSATFQYRSSSTYGRSG